MSQHKFGPGATIYTEPEHCQRDSDSPGVSDRRSWALPSCLLPSPQLKGRCYLKPPGEESCISMTPHRERGRNRLFWKLQPLWVCVFWRCCGVTGKNKQKRKSSKSNSSLMYRCICQILCKFYLKVWLLYHAYLISQGWVNSIWVDAANVYELCVLPNYLFPSELKTCNLIFPKDVT